MKKLACSYFTGDVTHWGVVWRTQQHKAVSVLRWRWWKHCLCPQDVHGPSNMLLQLEDNFIFQDTVY